MIYASDSMPLRGSWRRAFDNTSPNNTKMTTPDNGVINANAPLANPVDRLDIPFNATANIPYTIWMRLKASADSKCNGSLWVQFSNAQANGSPSYQIGSTTGLLATWRPTAARAACGTGAGKTTPTG